MRPFDTSLSSSFRVGRGSSTIALTAVVMLVFVLGSFQNGRAQWKHSAGWSSDLHLNPSIFVSSIVQIGNRMIANANCATNSGGSPDSLFLSTDNGVSWSNWGPGSHHPMVVAGNDLLGTPDSISNGNVIWWQAYSTNNGMSWLADTTGLPTGVAASSMVTLGNTIYAAIPGTGGSGVYQQTAPGAPWTPDTNGMTANGNYLVPITCMAVSSNTIVAGLLVDGIATSTDQGNSWNVTSTGMPQTTTTEQLATSGSSIFALTEDLTNPALSGLWNIYRSNDNGQTWSLTNSTPINGGADEAAAWFTITGSNIFVATDSGVFVSTNNGATFSTANTGFPPYDSNGFFATDIRISGPNVVVGTGDSGIWYRPLSDFGIASVSPENAAPTGLTLALQANPAYSSEAVTFSLPQTGPAKMELLNELGQQVEQIMNGPASAGWNTISFATSALQAGTYFVRLQSNGASAMQKFIVMP